MKVNQTVSLTGLLAISDKGDEFAMQVIINLVEKKCPNGEINVLMTDDCKDVVYHMNT